MSQALISAAASALGKRGARAKWAGMSKEERADERRRAWRTRKKRARKPLSPKR